MLKNETAILLGILKTAYPRFYQTQDQNEILAAVELWYEVFKNYPLDVVKYALKRLIESSKYPPAIAELKAQIESLKESKTPIDYWNEMLEVLNSRLFDPYYDLLDRVDGILQKERREERKRVFNDLPSPIKKFCGNPNQLCAYRNIEEGILNSVVKGQFLKNIEAVITAENERTLLPDNLKRLYLEDGE